MGQSLTCLLVHIVFSTKHRADLIPEPVEPELYAYIGGICRSSGHVLLAAGGTSNQVHLLVSLSRNISISQLMLEIKRDSSGWMKDKPGVSPLFYWQDGYGAFTIGASGIDAMRQYISRQKEHHARTSFEDEVRELCFRYGVEINERYVFD